VKRYILDASAVLALLNDEKSAERVEDVLSSRSDGQAIVYLSPISLGEIYYVTVRRVGEDHAAIAMDRVWDLHLVIPPIGAKTALQAAEFKAKTGLPYADSFSASLAQELGATLLTKDQDFKAAAKLIQVEFI